MRDINIFTKYTRTRRGLFGDFVFISEAGIVNADDLCSSVDLTDGGEYYQVRVSTLFTNAIVDCDSLDEVFQIVAEELG